MTFGLAAIEATQLLFVGTVAKVNNEFTDRLYSSWLWFFVPLVLIGVYLFWMSERFKEIIPASASNKWMLISLQLK